MSKERDFAEFIERIPNVSLADALKLHTVRDVGHFYGLTDDEIDSFATLPFDVASEGS